MQILSDHPQLLRPVGTGRVDPGKVPHDMLSTEMRIYAEPLLRMLVLSSTRPAGGCT